MCTSRFARGFVPTARFTKSGPTRRRRRAFARRFWRNCARVYAARFACEARGDSVATVGSGSTPRLPKDVYRNASPRDDFFWRRNTHRPNDGATGLPAQRLPRRNWICRGCGNGPSEANPGSVSERKARLLRELGVNRISLGVQSFDDGLLQLLGREHSAAQAEASFAFVATKRFRESEYRSDVRVARSDAGAMGNDACGARSRWDPIMFRPTA